MLPHRHLRTTLLAVALGFFPCLAFADEMTPPPAQSDAAGAMEQLSEASQSLYGRIAGSIIHVKLDQGYSALLTPAQRKDFLDWARSQPAESGAGTQQSASTTPPATPREQRRQTRNEIMQGDVNNLPAGPASVRPGLAALFRRYIDQKLKDPTADPALVAKLKQASARLQQPAGEMIGVVIDDQGNAIVLGGWVRDGAPGAIKATGPNGKEFSAKYLGGHPGRGIAIIQLETSGAAIPVPMADGAPAPGELLLCMTGNTGGMGWIVAPVAGGKKAGDEERFAVFGGEDRGATYLFNTKGQLAAVGFERFALPMDVLRNDVKWIIQNRKDVAPRQLGVKYGPVPPALRRMNRILANRPAVLVQDVVPGSPAELAGLKKDDIVVTIDRRPIWQMAQIQWDIATETDPVPVGIVRDDREITLEMPVQEKE